MHSSSHSCKMDGKNMGKRKLHGESYVATKKTGNVHYKKNVLPAKEIGNVFCVHNLRKIIHSENGVSALKEFAQACSEFHEIAKDYLKAGGSSQEILGVLESDGENNLSDITDVFAALSFVIIESSAESGGHYLSAEHASQQVLHCYWSIINKMLEISSSPEQKKQALHLLTAIASLSPELGCSVLSKLHFTSPQLKLITRQLNPLDKDSVRSRFIEFILSLLLKGNIAVIKHMLNKKGLLNSVLPGLMFDDASLVQLFLETLQSKVVENVSINKTSKLQVFNNFALSSLVALYSWLGPINYTQSKDKAKFKAEVINVANDMKETVRLSVHNILLFLCTSTKFGVVFFDKSLGMSGKHLNRRLYTFLIGMQPWEDEFLCDLVLKVLTMCPDLIKPVLASYELSFQTTDSKQWLKLMLLVQNIIHSVDIQKIEACFHEKDIPLHKLTMTAQHLLLPLPVLNSVCSSFRITHTSYAIRYQAINILLVALQKLRSFYEVLTNDNILKAKLGRIKQSCSNYILKHFVSCELLLEAWKLGTKNVIPYSETVIIAECQYFISLIDIFLLLKVMCPQLLDSIKPFSHCFNLTNLVETTPLLVIKNIELKFILETVDTSQNDFEKTLKILCSYISDRDSTVKEAALLVLREVLFSTGYFDGLGTELSVWIYCLQQYPGDSSELLVLTIATVLLNSKHIFQILAEADENTTEAFGDKRFNIEEVLNYVENSTDGLANECTLSLKPMLRLGPMLPAMLQVIEGNAALMYLSCAKKFAISVLVHLFHSQHLSSAFYNIIKHYKCDALVKVEKYLESWVTAPLILKCEPFHNNSVESRLSQVLLYPLQNESALDTILNEVKESDPGDSYIVNLVRLCIFYVTQLSKLNQLTQESIKSGVKALSGLLRLMSSPNEILHEIILHPYIVETFSPVCSSTYHLLSDLTFEILSIAQGQSLTDWTELLDPYESRISELLISAINNNLKLDCENLFRILKIIPLDAIHVEELFVKIISNLPLHKLISKGKLSAWGHLETSFLSTLAQSDHALPSGLFSKICDQLAKLCTKSVNTHVLQKSLLEYITRFPHHLADINPSLLGVLLHSEGCHIALAVSLVKSRTLNLVDLTHFLRETKSHENVFPILSAAVSQSLVDKSSVNDIVAQHTHAIVSTIMLNNSSSWLLDVKDIIKNSGSVEYAKKLSRNLKKQWKNITPSPITVDLLKSLCSKLKEKLSFTQQLLLWLHESLKSNADLLNSEYLFVAVQQSLQESEDNKWSNLQCSSELSQLILKSSLQSSANINATAINVFASLCSVGADIGKPKTIFHMITGHSEFINILLKNSAVKCELLKLIQLLVKQDHSLVKSSHIPVYLGAYNATLNEEDQIVLNILKWYEKCGVQLTQWRPYLWGHNAMSYYSMKTKGVLSVMRDSNEIFRSLNTDVLANTISHFPVNRSLQSDKYHCKTNIYDPAFWLPVLCQLVAIEEPLKCYKMTKSGALALTLRCLSSSQPDVRSVSYVVISRFHSHLMKTTKDHRLWLHFISALKKGVLEYTNQANPRLPSIVTLYLARASLLLTQPMHPLYAILHNLFLAKASINMQSIPLLELLHSKEIEHVVHQQWILKVLRDGINQELDLKIVMKNVALKFILGLYSCSTTEKGTRMIILEILEACVRKLPLHVGQMLTSGYGLLPWLSKAIDLDKTLVYNLIPVLASLPQNSCCASYVKLVLFSFVPILHALQPTPSQLTMFLNALRSTTPLAPLSLEELSLIIVLAQDILGQPAVQHCKDLVTFGCQFHRADQCKYANSDTIELHDIVLKSLNSNL